MPTITPSLIYWITRLDRIHSLLSGIAIVLFILSAAMIMAFGCSGDKLSRTPLHQLKRFVPIALGFVLLLEVSQVLLPTTKEMATIYVIPAVANSQQVQILANDSLNSVSHLVKLADQWAAEKLQRPKQSAD